MVTINLKFIHVDILIESRVVQMTDCLRSVLTICKIFRTQQIFQQLVMADKKNMYQISDNQLRMPGNETMIQASKGTIPCSLGHLYCFSIVPINAVGKIGEILL